MFPCVEQARQRAVGDHIASGRLSVVDRPDKRIQAFQEKLRKPIREQRHQEQAINWKAQDERERLRHERKRRAAGIAPRGAQEELEKATGYRDEFGRLNE
jgi:hypothetical protein